MYAASATFAANSTTMKATVTKIELLNYSIHSVYGGREFRATYFMETETNGITNQYEVYCKLANLEGGDVWMQPTSCEYLTNNEETLIESVIIDLFEESIR